jgi:hypothetical protein
VAANNPNIKFVSTAGTVPKPNVAIGFPRNWEGAPALRNPKTQTPRFAAAGTQPFRFPCRPCRVFFLPSVVANVSSALFSFDLHCSHANLTWCGDPPQKEAQRPTHRPTFYSAASFLLGYACALSSSTKKVRYFRKSNLNFCDPDSGSILFPCPFCAAIHNRNLAKCGNFRFCPFAVGLRGRIR